MNKTILAAAAAAACLLAAAPARADGMVEPMQTETSAQAPQALSRAAAGEQAPNARLSASLADQQAQASKRQATVKVQVSGLRLVDALSAGEQARSGEGHLSYQVDDDPIIETTATTMSFRDLDSGNHTITVMLSGNDHAPLGPSQTLRVNIP